MCIAPGKLHDGTEIACRLCWQCRNNRVNDWVGRCIAESKTAPACHAVTLTYGRDDDGSEDHPRAKALTYSDVQKYLKLLRRHGYPLRYFAVGEYGSLKGRAHWHLILYWQGKVPPHELDKRFDEPHWPHGVSHWTAPNYAAFKYNVKYIQKDMGKDERQAHLAMSKLPPLGSLYFMRRAEQFVEHGLAPQDLFYEFPDVLDGKGRKQRFMLQGRSAELFLEHFVRTWNERKPDRMPPNSELVSEFVDHQFTVREDAKGREIRPEYELDWAFERRWGAMIERIQKEKEWAANGSIGGIWNSAKYRRLSDGSTE